MGSLSDDTALYHPSASAFEAEAEVGYKRGSKREEAAKEAAKDAWGLCSRPDNGGFGGLPLACATITPSPTSNEPTAAQRHTISTLLEAAKEAAKENAKERQTERQTEPARQS